MAGMPVLMACTPEVKPFKSTDVTGASFGQSLQIKDHNGNLRTIEDFKGKIVIVFFGFAQCPDVCPTSMATMAEVKRLLGAQGDRLQVLFITVDPERDTQALLKEYMANFDPSFIALRPEPDELDAVASSFKVYQKKVPGSTPTTYTVDHSAGKYIFDSESRVRLFSAYGTDAATIASDIQILLSAA
ncbi:photosynthetic protein synthase I [Hydrogenophaga crassostreae]|uniref:Photosynthetic protein synthase I n=2 Tax=Hydrogenophaga crassostreae TaxID=1763535 RepID=A0A167I2P5_9BURK|nr:SCO family protein [Hydrogenophaga crassostreae]AOW15575.1 SCO family protein [Hydrogenophaga crassostreae]OAD42050.1 photosynthetic protein synthase I [Hydrogenophaga crassostreae]